MVGFSDVHEVVDLGSRVENCLDFVKTASGFSEDIEGEVDFGWRDVGVGG